MISEIVTQCTESTNILVHDMLEGMADQQAIEAASIREQNIRAQARYKEAHRDGMQATHERMMSQQTKILRDEVFGFVKEAISRMTPPPTDNDIRGTVEGMFDQHTRL